MGSLDDRYKKREYEGKRMDTGRQSEEVVMRWLRSLSNVSEVADLRDMKEWQRKDVDVKIVFTTGNSYLAEIKHDRHLGVTPNVLFEMLRINHTDPDMHCETIGWSARTPADWLLFHAPSANQIWQCDAIAFRQCFQAYTRERRGDTELRWINTDIEVSTLNALIPVSYCKHIFRIFPLLDRDAA